jgi:formylglycine-generating enzyme required for sulfatase activity
MQVLVTLAQRRGVVVTREQLVQRCWGGRVVSEDAINRALAKLRRLAELDDGRSFQVETVPKIGFRLVESSEAGEAASEFSSPRTENGSLDPALLRPSKSIRHHRLYLAPALVLCIIAATVSVFWYREHGNMRAALTNADPPAQLAAAPRGAVFRDCASGCPEMIVIPPGYFMMGSARADARGTEAEELDGGAQNESPQHEVAIRHPFALGRYDVTRAEYALFVKETKRPNPEGCYTLTRTGLYVETFGANWQRPGFPQSDSDPAVCINWNDAVAYTQWLSVRTGKSYRLPTEAEWEYVARAGSAAVRPGDGSAGSDCRLFNGADEDYHAAVPGDPLYEAGCHDGYAYTSPVGHFPPNAFGLFDLQGNAVQWLADCYHPNYDGAPVDGSEWTEAQCKAHVGRGGGWPADSRDNYFSRRGEGSTEGRWSANGFRVARGM